MNLESLREFCLSKPEATEDLPFDESTLVFRVGGKIFLLTDLENFQSINLKCDPGLAIDLREHYPCVVPGYHMNKKHWNTIHLDGCVPDQLIYQWIDHSYELVASHSSKKRKTENEGKK